MAKTKPVPTKAKPKQVKPAPATRATPTQPATLPAELATTPLPSAKQHIGRPQLPAGYAKASLTLKLSSVLFLDRLSCDIRSNTNAIVDRGAILRGVIEAIESSGISLDLSKCASEADITNTIKDRLCDD